jgi:hypothetical protein
MVIDQEVQGPGRAYWFDDSEEARVFAESKTEKGHSVSFDEEESYVWVSFSWKNHNDRVRLVEAGYDTLAV